nr:chloride channel protein [Desulfogranum marinum]
MAGFLAVAFRWLIGWEQSLLWPPGADFIDQYSSAPWWLKVGIPAGAGLVLGPLILHVAPEARGTGVPEVMVAINQKDGIIRHRITALKSLVTAAFIAAGNSVGREGPTVQIGASIGSSITQLFGMGPEQRKLAIACGAAAGIASIFQAPIAGTMFVVEILLFDLEVGSLSSIVIAAVTGTVVSRFFWDRETLFEIPFFYMEQPVELVFYFGLGIAAGFFSLLFLWAIFKTGELWEQLRIPQWLTPCIGGFIAGCIGLMVPEALGLGHTTMHSSLDGSLLLSAALIFLIAKLICTAVCVGSGMSGGIFAPSLFLGAMLGSLLGHLGTTVWPHASLSPSHFALIGMGAVVSGTTLAPITAIMTIFELTYNYEIILPLMTACIPAIIVVRLLHGYSIYETTLLNQGIRIVRGHDVNRLRAIKISDTMIREFETIRTHTPLHDLMDLVLTSSFPHFVVLDAQDRLAGVLSLRDVRAVLLDDSQDKDCVLAADLMSKKVVTVREDQNLEDAFHIFSSRHFSFLPVVAKDGPKRVVGYLKEGDLLTTYDQHILSEQVKPSARWICKLPE